MRFKEFIKESVPRIDDLEDFISSLSSRSSGPDDGTRGSEQEPSSDDDGTIRQGPPYTNTEQVRAVQQRLEELGYSVGRSGADGKYGPRTSRAVRAFKRDNNITPSNGDSLSTSDLMRLISAERVENPTSTGNSRGRSRNRGREEAGSVDPSEAKAVVEDFLGRRISDQEMDYLVRATAAEASPNAQERAAVAAVILNRARSNRFPDSIVAVLRQGGQFQAVTGTYNRRARQWSGPSRNFSDMSNRTGQQVMSALVRHLPRMDKTWLNFTSNNPRAYGRGTNINFMYAMRNAEDSQVIGQTVFGTV